MKLVPPFNAFFPPALVLFLITAGCGKREPIPGIVNGASMAPTYLGEHFEQTCEDCGANLIYDASGKAPPGHIVCFNCGFRENSSKDARIVKPQPVFIHQTEGFNRWDVVAFLLPESKEVGIKRIVGLSGEALEIKDGDVFKHGKILSKPLEVQRQIRIPVYDSRFHPRKSEIESRWQEPESGDNWKSESGELSFTADPEQSAKRLSFSGEISWINYRHWRCCSHGESRETVFPLEDIDAFNPRESRRLNRMDDIYIEITLAHSKDSLFSLRLNRERETLEFLFDLASNSLRVVRPEGGLANEANLEIVPLNIVPSKDVSIEISTIDDQLIVLVDGKQAFRSSLDSQALPMVRDAVSQAAMPFLQLGAAIGNLKVNRVQIWRDIYYLSGDTADLSCGGDEFILLGDNSVVSMDSRNWPNAGVKKSQIIGLVKNSEND